MATDSGKLTVLGIKSLGAGKHFDGDGLYLDVKPTLSTSDAADALVKIAERAPTLAVKAHQYLKDMVTSACSWTTTSFLRFACVAIPCPLFRCGFDYFPSHASRARDGS
ncbi:MAG: hypothetical protein QM599_13665 [Pseudoxanthomonas sp.]